LKEQSKQRSLLRTLNLPTCLTRPTRLT